MPKISNNKLWGREGRITLIAYQTSGLIIVIVTPPWVSPNININSLK